MAIGDKNLANGDFWCNFAAESIYNSTDRRTKAAETLKTVITWAFGLFSTGGFIISVFGNIKEFYGWALLAFGGAFFLLTIAYCVANMAQYPIAQTYDPQDPKAIAQSFSTAVNKQKCIFNAAVVLSSIGFFLFALGLLLQFATIKNNISKPVLYREFKLNTSVYLQAGKMFIPVAIHTLKNDSVKLDISSNTAAKVGKSATEELLFSTPLKADTGGVVYYSYSQAANKNIDAIKVTASRYKKSQDTLTEEKTIVSLKVK